MQSEIQEEFFSLEPYLPTHEQGHFYSNLYDADQKYMKLPIFLKKTRIFS